MHEDIKWFLGFLVVIGLLWFGAHKARQLGTPSQSGGATSTPLESGAFPTHGADMPYTPESQQVIPPTGVYRASPNNYYENPSPPLAPPTSVYTQETPPPDPRFSPLYGRLFIRSVNPGYEGDSSTEYVIIQSSQGNAAPVSITGLTLQSAVTHIGAKIPKAWKLPYPGISGEGETVALPPGETAYIITGRSRNGLSFELNKCTGYLDRSQTFSPPLPLDCPAPVTEPLPRPPNALSEACYDYLATFSGCAIQEGELPENIRYDGNCQAHLTNNIGYNQCIQYHKNEPDFFRGEWRLFLNRDGGLWRDHRETIELLDQNGKFIHAYSI